MGHGGATRLTGHGGARRAAGGRVGRGRVCGAGWRDMRGGQAVVGDTTSCLAIAVTDYFGGKVIDYWILRLWSCFSMPLLTLPLVLSGVFPKSVGRCPGVQVCHLCDVAWYC